ncbi:MAG: IPT/TIG domain-containing protein [Chryseolinea sp.]
MRRPQILSSGLEYALIAILTITFTITSCDEENKEPPTSSVSGISPLSGLPGSTATISGNNFSASSTENEILFNGKSATLIKATALQLDIKIPENVDIGPVTVIVKVKGKTAGNPLIYTVEQPTPDLSAITPSSAPSLSIVTITGKYFDTNPTENEVTFNGKSATIKEVNSTEMKVEVPQLPPGEVSVALKVKSKAASKQFIFTVEKPLPRIEAFAPTSGSPYTLIKITGKHFSAVMADNVVLFGDKFAVVKKATETLLEVLVPPDLTPGTVSVVVKVKTRAGFRAAILRR